MKFVLQSAVMQGSCAENAYEPRIWLILTRFVFGAYDFAPLPVIFFLETYVCDVCVCAVVRACGEEHTGSWPESESLLLCFLRQMYTL